METTKIAVIGAGPAGLAAAQAVYGAGISDCVLIERDHMLGGILNQCIHDGFGLHLFGQRLTGPEYANRYIRNILKTDVRIRKNTMVVDISKDKVITTANPQQGYRKIRAEAIILATGCRERPLGALGIAGSRPSGIYTAGTVQRLINIEGHLPGKQVVILGSGDVGLIMARRLQLEGATVHAVLELLPYSSGLTRNIVQCLDDYDIPLRLSHTVTGIFGKNRIEAVEISKTDENRKPIDGTQTMLSCDTLVLSVGLIPENDIPVQAGVVLDHVTHGAVADSNLMTSIDGIFSCGNALHVHDLVDFVSMEGERAGRCAAEYVKNGVGWKSKKTVRIECGENVRYSVPHTISSFDDDVVLSFRVTKPMKQCTLIVETDEQPIKTVQRNFCTPGEMERIVLEDELLAELASKKTLRISALGTDL